MPLGRLFMSKKYFFSINLLIKSDTNLEKSISTIISNQKFFSENIQLILIDSIGTELSLKICSEYSKRFSNNIFFVDCVNKTTAECYNDARMLCTGRYITYTDNYGEYSANIFPMLFQTIRNSKIPIICVEPFISVPGGETTPYVTGIKKGIVKLKDNPDKFILMLGCYFFNRSVISDTVFDTKLKFHTEEKFITEILLKTYSYVFFDKFSYTTSSASEREFFRYSPQYSKAFYIPAVNDFIIPMLKSYVGSALVESIMMYLIDVKFALNSDDKYKNVILGSYVTEFFNVCAHAMQYIDDAIILNKNLCTLSGLDREVAFRFLRLKYKDCQLKPTIDIALPNEHITKTYYDINNHSFSTELSGEFAASVNDAIVAYSKDINVKITAINYDSDGLYFDAVLQNCSYLDDKDFTVYTTVNQKRFDTIKSEAYTLIKLFGTSFLRKYSFRFFIPVSKGKQIDVISLNFKTGKLSFRMNITFESVHSRLSTQLKNSYWHFLDKVLTYDKKTKSLVVRKATDSFLGFCENKFIAEAGKYLSVTELFHYRQLRASCRRMRYDKTDHKYIMFYDDMGINYNGNLLFRYFSKFKRNEKIDVFFSAKRDSEEEAFLNDAMYENVLESGSRKAKITALSSDIIIATDCDVYEALGFSETDKLYLRDLFDAKILSVKNFFMNYASAQFDNRLRDNTQLVFCASEKEKKYILKSVYDYDESMIKVTGYPMLDALNNEKEKLILVAPGDRRTFCIYENSEYYRFSESRFFKVYNRILTDIKLLEQFKKHGYKIAVLMPPAIEKYSKLFHNDDIVKVYPYTEQNETALLSKSSLLLTDYSELQYRFAYLNKPVVYYFPNELPIQYEYKNERLSRNGFGEIIFEHDKLIDYLCKGLKNDFAQPPKYEQRCNSFFKYRDTDNCGRIFDEVINTFFHDI